MKLLLFDIDGTLMLSGGIGLHSMSLAFQELFGLADPFSDIKPHGKTDPQIFRDILRSRGVQRDGSTEDQLVAEICQVYERYMHREMPRATGARLMPGVRELLPVLQQRSDLQLGLLTGNLEPTARIKLQHFDLNRFFPFGAYSSDAEVRAQLVPIAVARAAQHAGIPFDLGPEVVIIGDTPLDVDCALANGVTAVGVATNSHTTAELREAGAHLVLDDLADTKKVVAALLAPPP